MKLRNLNIMIAAASLSITASAAELLVGATDGLTGVSSMNDVGVQWLEASVGTDGTSTDTFYGPDGDSNYSTGEAVPTASEIFSVNDDVRVVGEENHIEVKFTISNDGYDYLDVEEIRFDASKLFNGSPAALTVQYVDGDFSGVTPGANISETFSVADVNKVGDFPDFSVDLTSLADYSLGFNESATFAIVPSSASAGASTYIDNLGVFGTTGPASVVTVPKIEVSGNGNLIVNNSTTPETANQTLFPERSIGSIGTNEFTISSTGSTNLVLTGSPDAVQLSGDTNVFSMVLQPNLTDLAAGTSTTFQISYEPLVEDTTNTATVSVLNNDTNYTFEIQGISVLIVPDIDVISEYGGFAITNNQTEVDFQQNTDFSTAYVGEPVTNNFLVRNTGYTNLSVTGASISGSSELTIIPPVPGDVAPGTNIAFSVIFTPTLGNVGVLQTASVIVSNNVAGKEAYTFAVSGTGQIAAPGEIIAAWTHIDPALQVAPQEVHSSVEASYLLTGADGAGAWDSSFKSSLDHTYGSTGGREYFGDPAGGTQNKNILWHPKNDTISPVLTLTVSNASASASINLSSLHYDAMIETLGNTDTVVINYSGDISGVVSTDTVTTVYESGFRDGQDFDHAINGVLEPQQTVSFNFMIDTNNMVNFQDIFLDNFSIKGTFVEDPYLEWISTYTNGVAAEADADPDGDGLDNTYEFGLGGNPVDAEDTGYAPTYGSVEEAGQWFEYVHPRRVDSGLTYYLELTDMLTNPVWTNMGYSVVGVGGAFEGDSAFEAVTNRIDTVAKDHQFLRLIIEQ
ncbi:choice-of-anchor D domain-containing protein [Pontiella sulfatireligans]|uniref:HYDIN/VesB/CFA65-like Ig-like domain-containing protein n=1 Tax=Pontiella sulfatireligans TaxID=2750658 RepID=A0A6C2UPM5_9BACT|nr:choice-of-anchor D domain-containing protein [Pontiella sulfatireligans]VGO21883.1 hypothetical protein SCARR_03963 [Pontiella sulfatireligans]